MHLRIVVTYAPVDMPFLWGQDKSGVGFAWRPAGVRQFPLGEALDVEGVTDPGGFGPCVRITKYRDLGQKGLPKPVEVPLRRLLSGAEDGRRISVRGRLVAVTLPAQLPGRTTMVLISDGTRLSISLDGVPLQSTSTLLDSEVQLDATPSLRFNPQRQFTGVTLNVAKPEDVKILVPGSRSVPVSKIEDLLKYRPGGITDARVRVEGVATYCDGRALLAVQNGQKAIFAQLAEPDAIRIGSWVSVLGYPQARAYTPILTDARAFSRTKAAQVTPLDLKIENAFSGRFDAKLVRLTVELVSHVFSREDQTLTVKSNSFSFVADFPKHSPDYVSDLKDGSILHLTGVMRADRAVLGNGPNAFHILLRDGDDVTVLKQPPWLTRTHLIYIAEILAALLVVILIWVSVLRRQVYRQTKKLWEQRHRAAQREESHRVLVENASDLIFTISEQGRFLLANPATSRVTGRTLGDLTGTQLQDLILESERESFTTWFERLIKDSYSTGEFDIRTTSGSIRTLDLSAHVSNSSSNRSQVEFVGRDVTARKRTHAALEQARQAAESANAAKTRFLANMSHEIRTPLNAILGTADLLSATDLTTDQRAYVATFQNSGNTLLHLLNGILDLTRVESGQLQLEAIVFPIETAVSGVAAMMSAAAREKRIRLDWQIDRDVPQYVVGDPTRIRQILTNLIGNAIKFTESGNVKIRVSVSAEQAPDTSSGKVMLAFMVTDSGIGISNEKLELIFERFTQADGSTTRKFGGSGLGLSISKGLAEIMGGSIAVASEPGKGSQFTLLLPLGIAPVGAGETQITPDAASTSRVLESLRAKRASLLVAEDNEANRMVIQAFLREFPLVIDWASNGVRAVEMEAQGSYDLILMDIEMPEMDGYEATRRICERRRNEGLPPVKILALTAHAFDENRSQAEKSGCAELLTKPIRRRILLAALARHLEERATEGTPLIQ